MNYLQEARGNNQDQRKQDLYDVNDHQRLVQAVVKSLCNIEYHLEKLKTVDAEYMGNPASRKHAEERLKRRLKMDFQLLELTDQRNYINTFGPFYRLYYSLKKEYDKEVPVSENPQPETH